MYCVTWLCNKGFSESHVPVKWASCLFPAIGNNPLYIPHLPNKRYHDMADHIMAIIIISITIICMAKAPWWLRGPPLLWPMSFWLSLLCLCPLVNSHTYPRCHKPFSLCSLCFPGYPKDVMQLTYIINTIHKNKTKTPTLSWDFKKKTLSEHF